MNILVIGCGVMGSAFAKYFARSNRVFLSDRNQAKAQALAAEIGAVYREDLKGALQESDVILLAIKPKDLSSLATGALENKILLSILAGTSLTILKKHFPKAIIVRTMPNLALSYGQGVMGLVKDGLSQEVRTRLESLLQGIGLITWMSEDKIEALTALSGSGIAFILVMIEAMIDGGVHLGFTAPQARELVLKTMEGAIALLRESGKHPAELKLQIASPGGTTIAGLKVLEEEGVRSGIVHALAACHAKALNMLEK